MLKWEKVDVFDVFDGNNIDETIEKLKKLKEQYKDGCARFTIELGETYSTSEHAYIFHLLGEKK
jgi:pantothenate kinase